MKTRWTKTGVRFRISPTELAKLEAGERIEEKLMWRNQEVWRAAIEIGETTALNAVKNGVTFKLSLDDRLKLFRADAEGVYFSENDFRYSVEKDFPCAHPRAIEANEPESETFAAPPDFADRKNQQIS